MLYRSENGLMAMVCAGQCFSWMGWQKYLPPIGFSTLFIPDNHPFLFFSLPAKKAGLHVKKLLPEIRTANIDLHFSP